MPDEKPREVRTVAVLGAGLIGASWATLFAAHDLAVRLWDPRDVREEVRGSVHQFGGTVPGGPYDPRSCSAASRSSTPSRPRHRCRRACPTGAGERPGAARRQARALRKGRGRRRARGADLLVDVGDHADGPRRRDGAPGAAARRPPVQPTARHPARRTRAGREDRTWAVDAAAASTEPGQVPGGAAEGDAGFVANRLQSAVFKESVHLVLEGVVDQAELDTIMTESLAHRWATAGPFRSMHLGGGPAACGTCSSTSARGCSGGGGRSASPS